jgi:eukaryotic-like serine/threonine-protein kinase
MDQRLHTCGGMNAAYGGPSGRASKPLVSPGDIIAGRYRVGALSEVSARGLVYQAKHVRLGFPVSLQLLGPEPAGGSQIWRRCARELKALGALHNEHVLRVHDAGTLPSGVRYLVTERLTGTDLASVLREQGPLTVDVAADQMCQVCSALADAHRLGIIHRNVRPENVFLARTRAAQPVVKLLDFGVSLFLAEPGGFTIPGCGVLSPAYLSPEQLRNPNAVDQRSDVWAVGLVLFEALIGRSPFAGFGGAQIVRALSEGPMPLLPLACPNVPKDLARVVQQCLERDPARRPCSADDVAKMLEPFSSRPGRQRVPAATEQPAAGALL